MTIFYGFTRKTETSWAKKIVKFILENWNVDVIVYVWFIYFRIKNAACRKNNVKCTKCTIKKLK